MSALASLKRNWLLAALVLLCALTVFAAFVAPSEIGKMELELEASTAATRIGAELLSGAADGTLIVYLDQSEQANALSRYFGLIAGVTLLLLGAGVANPDRACLDAQPPTARGRSTAVTAEGVESEDQAAMLRDFGCPQAQGFLYGQP